MLDFSMADPRTSGRGEWMFERIVSTGSLVLSHVGDTRAGVVGIQRFLSSPYVTPEGILATFCDRAREASMGRRVIVAQDTTEINFSGRGGARTGLGPAGDGKSPGFFIHPNLVIDADDEAVLGLAGAQIWTRSQDKVSARSTRAAQDKESARWLAGTRAAAQALVGHASQVIGVCDREGDVWDHFVNIPEGMDMVIRSRHNRAVESGKLLFDALADQPVLIVTTVKLAPKGPGDKGRTAQIALRAGQVRLQRPRTAPQTDPETLDIGFVEAIEQDPPTGVSAPLAWRLLTTLPVETAAHANDVVRCYRLRWRIEEVFRTLKRDGLALEQTQVHSAEHLFRLSAMGLGAAVRILQLVDARDGSSRPISDVLDPSLTPLVALIVRSREGATQRQKNPHPQGSLPWLAWIVARHGGWNCYGKPPGPKTMANGWKTFSATLAGVVIASQGELP